MRAAPTDHSMCWSRARSRAIACLAPTMPSSVILGGVSALVKHEIVPSFENGYPIYAGACWALVMYLFYYQRGNLQKSLDTSMHYLYLASEQKAAKLAAAPSSSAALVGGSASATALVAERGVGGVLYAIMEWCLQDL